MSQQGPSNGKKKKFRVELSQAGLFLGALGFVFVLGWIFILGILVGRGFVPEGVRSLGHMTEQLTRLVTILGSDRERSAGTVSGLDHQARLEFYDQLAGTAPGTPERNVVKIQPASPAPSAPAPAAPEPPGAAERGKARWVVQVASLDNEAKAAALTERLKTRGYPAYTYRTFIQGSAFHRVRCGPFETRAEAEAAKQLLAEREKINAFLTTVEN